MLKSVGYIEIVTDDGGWHGTGWVVDAEQRLLVTNQHVVETYLDCYVYFPEYSNGKLNTDPDTSLTSERAHLATVIDSDETLDLALIQLDDELPEGIIALELADKSAAPGSDIHSLAGGTVGSQSLWIYSTGHVRQIVQGELANGFETTVLESDMATNQGNSGGPVCDDDGKVVAVVEGHATDARLVSIYVDLQPLVDYLGDALRCVDPTTVEDLQFAAQRHMDAWRTTRAIELATEAIKKSPKSAELYTLRGWAWYWDDDNDTAKEDFKDALKVDSNFSDAHYGLGCVANEAGEYEEAVGHFTDAIRNDSRNADYLIDRGEARRSLGQLKKAKKDFESALYADEYNLTATCGLAYVETDLGNNQEALEHIGSVLDYVMDDPEAMYYCGLLMHRTGEKDAAVKYFTATTNLDPEYQWGHYYLGLTLLENQQPEPALEAISIALQQTPGDAETVFQYGLTLIANERTEEGLSEVKRAAKMAPDHAAINKALQNLLNRHASSQSSSTTPVSTSRVPAKFVGKWAASLQRSTGTRTFLLTLGSAGEYSMEINERSGSRSVEVINEKGAYVINGDRLVYSPSGVDESVSVRTKWEGQFLSLYMESLSGWVLFAKK